MCQCNHACGNYCRYLSKREPGICFFLLAASAFNFSCCIVILYHVAIVFQEWLSRATNWAKFSATAGLGVIHRGHLQQGRALMAPYLPQSGAVGGGSPYSEGGALYALGLIHANHGEGIKQFLRESLRNSSAEVIIVYFLSFILLFISCILC
jgi:hypothetical protein